MHRILAKKLIFYQSDVLIGQLIVMRKLFRVVEDFPFEIAKAFLSKLTEKHSSGNRKWLIVVRGKKFYSQDSSRNVVSSPLGEVTVPDLLFHDFVCQNWSLWEGKTAVVCGNTGRKYTYRNLRSHSKALAAALQNKLNISKGDVLAIVLPNCPEYPIVVLASSLIGVIPTTINPVYTVDEMQRHMGDCKVKLVVTNSKGYEKCASVVQLLKNSAPILVVKHTAEDIVPQGGIDLLELFNRSVSGDLTTPDVSMDDTLVLPYSSGTTGAPKGVILTHRNVVSNLTQICHPETLLLLPTTRLHQEKVFAVLPMFHIFGLMVCTFFSLREGCRIVLLSAFNPQLFVNNLYLKRVNILYAVPQIISLLAHKEVKGKYLKHVRFIVNGASSLAIRDANTVMEKAEHVKVVQGYGMTETSPVIAHTSSKRMQKLSSIGIPVASTKLKIVNPETGESLPKGEKGELCVRGPQVMKGYLNQPELTANAFDKDGWLKTGDLAYFDEHGDFFLVQRMKELIKVKGFQVAPYELEEVLRTHPKIADAAVVGVPDPHHGEVPRAFVILQEGVQMTEDEVKEYIRKKLAHYKQLKGGVRFVEDFPRNRTGKIIRPELQKMS